ncbi:MAG: GNAT family N-acetyltransferase [Planctomycetota bacterium]|jgi:L-amino acid N-acyltransferase YncA
MSRFQSALYILRSQGIWGIFRKLRAEIYSQTKMWLVQRTWDPTRDRAVGDYCGITFREASYNDVEKIVAIWPSEFTGIAKSSEILFKLIKSKFDRNIPCFVACDGNTVVGAIWCAPWSLHAALPKGLRTREAYVLHRGFLDSRYRRKGIFSKLELYAIQVMAEGGKTVAYGRILPERTSSIKLHEKLGFQTLGLLTSGSFLGLHYCRLDESVLHKAEEEEAL